MNCSRVKIRSQKSEVRGQRSDFLLFSVFAARHPVDGFLSSVNDGQLF